jgi:large subunit ribosomal protein L30
MVRLFWPYRRESAMHRRLKGFVFMDGMIKIKLYRSPICTPQKHKRVVLGLGLRKVNQIVERPDSPVFRGMVNKVPHLLKVVE